eukprot:GHVR01053044.1.p1 GENE.GHVR01053044.1~~GHVR01053044.1.p1  ORF type:complete len:192 (+),score=20.97 GHVR01053044.1:306-881(+)
MEPIFWVLVSLFFELIATGMMMPILPFYALEEVGLSRVQFGVMIALYAIGQLIGSYILGRLADIIGRRPVVLLSFLWSSIGLLFTSFSYTPYLLIFIRFIHGLGSSTISKCQVCITDLTTDIKRTRYMGILGLLIGLAFVIGPGGTCIILAKQDVSRIFIIRVASSVAFFGFILAFFKFPETIFYNNYYKK